MKRYLFLLLSASSLFSEPWGKDADLCKEPCKEAQCHYTPIIGKIGEKMIRFHQEIISPADGPRSHFYPSSSQYTLEAMRTHGFLNGFLLGCDRLMRENSEEWVYRKTVDGHGKSIKSDPVKKRVS